MLPTISIYCKKLNFRVSTELAHKCKSRILVFGFGSLDGNTFLHRDGKRFCCTVSPRL